MRSAALPGDASPPWKRGSGTERGRWTWTGPNRRLAAASPRCLLPYFLACQQRGRWAGPRRRDNNSAVRSGDRQTPTPPPGAPAGRRAPARHLSRGAGARRPVVHWCWGAAALRLSGTGRGRWQQLRQTVRALPSPSAARPTNRVGRTGRRARALPRKLPWSCNSAVL